MHKGVRSIYWPSSRYNNKYVLTTCCLVDLWVRHVDIVVMVFVLNFVPGLLYSTIGRACENQGSEPLFTVCEFPQSVPQDLVLNAINAYD